jgi:hypothetical protein
VINEMMRLYYLVSVVALLFSLTYCFLTFFGIDVLFISDGWLLPHIFYIVLFSVSYQMAMKSEKTLFVYLFNSIKTWPSFFFSIFIFTVFVTFFLTGMWQKPAMIVNHKYYYSDRLGNISETSKNEYLISVDARRRAYSSYWILASYAALRIFSVKVRKFENI